MNPKQFDHIENKIKEAAESLHPSFDELSWEKMNVLLDKQEKDHRRPFAWWWFVLPFLFIGGTASYLFVKNYSSKNTTQQSLLTSNTIKEKLNTVAEKKVALPLPIVDELIKTNKNVSDSNISNRTTLVTRQYLQKKGVVNIKIKSIDGEEDNVTAEKNIPTLKIKNAAIDGINKVDKENETKASTDLPKQQNSVVVIDTAKTVKKDIASTDTSNKFSSKKKDADKKKKKVSGVYLLAAIGADAGSVKFLSLKNSTITARYGIGVGYQFNKRFSVQTGFYAGHKKYVAGAGDYTVKAGTYLSIADIEKVNADCLIYEIPLAVRYNIFPSAKTTYYTTVGISSFIMKNEDYYYYYKIYNMPDEAGHTYTGNKNLFSVFTLSAGIEQKLSKRFFLQVEPSVSIPIAGVGEGKVKLYSTTLQVGLKYQLPHK